MKSKFIICLFAVMLFSLIANNNIFSQMEQEGHLYTMTFMTLPNNTINEFLEFYEQNGKLIDAQNEHVLSVKILTHAWGPPWLICLITEYKDWDGFRAGEKKQGELFEKQYPDKSKRDELGAKWGGFLKGHTDAIVVDNPKLAK